MLRVFFVCLMVLAITGGANAMYPERTIKVVTPLGADTLGSAAAHVTAAAMSKILGQQLIIENRTGADGALGVNEVIHANPDGYTIGYFGDGMITTIHPAYELSGKKPPYEPRKDVAPIGFVLDSYFVILAAKELPIDSVRKLLEYKNGELPFAVPNWTGKVGVAQLRGLGAPIRGVFYSNEGTAQGNLRAGHIKGMYSLLYNALPLLQDGAARALGVLGHKRHPLLADIPTVDEQGYLSLSQFPTWQGFFCPRECPPAVVSTLNKALNQALRDPEVQKKILGFGATPHPSTPQELGDTIRESIPALREFMVKENLRLIE